MSAVHLTKADFLTRVANYEANPNEWKFLGERPALIDFYATWCGPCKMLAPVLDELADEYAGQVDIYKKGEPYSSPFYGFHDVGRSTFGQQFFFHIIHVRGYVLED